jgi:hypothetical protein
LNSLKHILFIMACHKLSSDIVHFNHEQQQASELHHAGSGI